MLEKFNKELSFIIKEDVYKISPKFIDKEYKCSKNKVDLFISKKFINSIGIIYEELLKLISSNFNINDIKLETSVIIYITRFEVVYSGIILPTSGNRHEIILLNSWKSNKIPHLETTGQIRIII